MRAQRAQSAAERQGLPRAFWPHAPGVQLVYIALVTAGYFVFLRDAAPLLPGPYASEVHLCVARPLACAVLR